jgi:hypothetical protein
MEWQEAEANCKMKSFVICIFCQVKLKGLNGEGLERQGF